jgi:hypothetical protein
MDKKGPGAIRGLGSLEGVHPAFIDLTSCRRTRRMGDRWRPRRLAMNQFGLLACFNPYETVRGPSLRGVVGQFDCGRVPRWKMTDSGRILAGWHERNTNPC